MKPLVSCICITQNRRFFLRQAIEYFIRAQHYCQFECELIITDGSERINREVAELEYDDIHYFHIPSKPHTQQGKNYNDAYALSKGDIIIRWDDDDWQSPERIDKQVKALNNYRSNGMGLAFTSQYYGYHLADRQAFRSRCWNAPGQGTMGGAMAFHRSVWAAIPHQDVDQAEDALFFQDCIKNDIPMCDMLDSTYYIYIRHNQNGSAHSNSNYESTSTHDVRTYLSRTKDINFYDELSEILPLSQWNHPTTFGQHGMYAGNRKIQEMMLANRVLPQPNVPKGNNPFKR